ncbi:DUF2254 domain-containing protein [Paracoccus tegillarcae]|uniref:DUF2254 domain-containing protein n=2 Tax=Paracoccus tegillarcae TaxID=1529068 RepID=A0A2K9EF24_9RHOB|nr:DUF2254 domain-containing protein [Paracoccus tegillarcae]
MVHVASYAVMGLIVAALASLATNYLPWALPFEISTDAIDSLLTIIATSMLTITTFSLGALTSAYSSATSNGTARATGLLTEDEIVQSSLATFVGSFLFSIVGLIALKVSFYGPQGRALLFIVTLVVIAMIVVALLRLINQLTKLGRVADTISRIENTAKEAMENRLQYPFLGGKSLPDVAHQARRGLPVRASTVGYVQFITIKLLADICEQESLQIDVLVLPGSFVYEDSLLAHIHSQGDVLPEGIEHLVHNAFEFGPNRSFDQDPRFGLIALTEVALRALSPAVNDPGTAIDVIGRQTRLLSYWGEAWAEAEKKEPEYPNVSVLPLIYEDMYEDAFNLIARDGAAQIDVMSRLLKSLTALTRIGPMASRRAAQHQLDLAYERSLEALSTEAEKGRLKSIYKRAIEDAAA